jgi:hypothetical protein
VIRDIGAIGADKLSAKRYQTRKGTSYAHSVAHIMGSPVTLSYYTTTEIYKEP